MFGIDRFLLFVALPIVVAASLLEAALLSRRGGYYWRAAGVSLLDLALRVAIQIVAPLTIAAPLIALAYRHRLATIPLDSFVGSAVLFLGQEFCYYWYHRAAHRVRWFWCTHVVHHSPNQFNLCAAYRFGWTGKLTGTPRSSCR